MWLKPLTFLLALVPLGYVVVQIYLLQTGARHGLGADPGKEVVLLAGEWAIRLLLLTLLVSPIRHITGWRKILQIRRMLGLFTFFYASLHLAAYSVFLLELDFGAIGADIAKRPYITVGFVAWLLLMPLAITSTNAMMARLGRHWKLLHRASYIVGALAVIHVVWLTKADYALPVSYGLILLLALSYRFIRARAPLFRSAVKVHS